MIKSVKDFTQFRSRKINIGWKYNKRIEILGKIKFLMSIWFRKLFLGFIQLKISFDPKWFLNYLSYIIMTNNYLISKITSIFFLKLSLHSFIYFLLIFLFSFSHIFFLFLFSLFPATDFFFFLSFSLNSLTSLSLHSSSLSFVSSLSSSGNNRKIYTHTHDSQAKSKGENHGVSVPFYLLHLLTIFSL